MAAKREFLICLPDGRGARIFAYSERLARNQARRLLPDHRPGGQLPDGTQVLEVKCRRSGLLLDRLEIETRAAAAA